MYYLQVHLISYRKELLTLFWNHWVWSLARVSLFLQFIFNPQLVQLCHSQASTCLFLAHNGRSASSLEIPQYSA